MQLITILSCILQPNEMLMTITLYHNPRCSKSRQVLNMLEGKHVSFEIVEYLKNPLDMTGLKALIAQMQVPVHEVMRLNEDIAKEMDLSKTTDENSLLDAMVKHPILMNRPIVKTLKGVRLCRPVEKVLEIV